MENEKVNEFSERYLQLDEWEIADLYAKADSLTEEARIALDAVIADRKIDLNKIHQEIVVEKQEAAASERKRMDKIDKRDSRLFKILLIIGIPITILGASFRPEKSYETLISTLIQVVGLVIIVWVVSAIQRKFRDKNTRKNK